MAEEKSSQLFAVLFDEETLPALPALVAYLLVKSERTRIEISAPMMAGALEGQAVRARRSALGYVLEVIPYDAAIEQAETAAALVTHQRVGRASAGLELPRSASWREGVRTRLEAAGVGPIQFGAYDPHVDGFRVLLGDGRIAVVSEDDCSSRSAQKAAERILETAR